MNPEEFDRLELECKEVIRSWYRNLEPGNKNIDCFTYETPIPHTDLGKIFMIQAILRRPEVKFAYAQVNNPDLPKLEDGSIDNEAVKSTFQRVACLHNKDCFNIRYFQSIKLRPGEQFQIRHFDDLESFTVKSGTSRINVKLLVKYALQFTFSKTLRIDKHNRKDMLFSENLLPVPRGDSSSLWIEANAECEIIIRGILWADTFIALEEKKPIPATPIDYTPYGFRRDI